MTPTAPQAGLERGTGGSATSRNNGRVSHVDTQPHFWGDWKLDAEPRQSGKAMQTYHFSEE